MLQTSTKSYGLIMSSPMILAYKDGRKTQTRRLKGLHEINAHPDNWELVILTKYNATFSSKVHKKTKCIVINLPYGGVGDTLYFKETYQLGEREKTGPKEFTQAIYYKADTQFDIKKWRSSMFMKRVYSRFYDIPILRVRIERLHDITDQDARNEGFVAKTGRVEESPHDAYLKFWDVLNGKKLPASKNPWVWVYEFPAYGK